MIEFNTLGNKRKAYILTFDRDLFTDYKTFHDRLVAFKEIESWFHYLKSSYVLISRSSASALSMKISRLAPKQRFLIVELNLKNRNGVLPTKAWEWLQKFTQESDEINPNNLLR